MSIIFRIATKAYVTRNGMYCIPYPLDESIPEEIHKQFDKQWEEADDYAIEHPEDVTVEYPPAEQTEKEKLAQEIKNELAEKQAWLSAHDYIGTKIATGRATAEEYADEVATMKQYAVDINALNAELAELEQQIAKEKEEYEASLDKTFDHDAMVGTSRPWVKEEEKSSEPKDAEVVE